MAYQRIASSENRFHKWTEVGEVLAGAWIGSKVGKKYDNTIGEIELGDGSTVAFSLTSGLVALERVIQGTQVKIVFKGEKETKRGAMKTFDVFVDTDGSAPALKPVERQENPYKDAKPNPFKATEEDVPF